MQITLDISDDVAIIVMDDGKANAFSHKLLEELEPALDEAEQKAKAVVLAGRSGVFCGGFDLKVIKGGDAEDAARLSSRGGWMIHRLFNYPKPLVAAATGHAIALGALVLLGCDTRVGPKGDFKFGLNETAINAPLPIFGTEIANARLARECLTESVIQAKIYDPEGAIAAGYLDQIVPAQDVIDRAVAVASELGELPGEAYARNKRFLRRGSLEIIAASLT